MAASFQEAFDAARARYTAHEWLALKPSAQVAAIYLEMRRIDAQHVAAALEALEAALEPAVEGRRLKRAAA